MIDRVVIGSGPVGLVAAHLLGCVAIGKRVGSGPISKFAPTYLWRTDAMNKLLGEIGIVTELRVARFCFLDAENVSAKCDYAMRAVYYRRSRGIPLDVAVEIPVSAMSSGLSGEIPTYTTTVDEFAEALSRRVEVISDNVVSISLASGQPTIYFGGAGTAGWSNGRNPLMVGQIVNTLPAPTFDRLIRRERTLTAAPKTFVVGRPHLDSIRRMIDERFEFGYVVDPVPNRIPYDRVRVLDDGLVSYEFNAPARDVSNGFLASVAGHVAFSGPAQISGATVPEYDGMVRNVGRMARWDHSIRIHDVVEHLSRGA